MSTRQDAIRRAKALLQKTVANGATEAEMLASLSKANAIIEAHELTDADLLEARAEAVKEAKEAGEEIFDPNGIKWRISGVVGNYTNTEIYRIAAGKGLHMIGAPSDIEWAKAILQSCSDHVCTKLEEFLWTCREPQSEHRTIRSNFASEASYAIQVRIQELMRSNEVARTSKGTELMVIKSGAVEAYMAERGIKIRVCSGSGPSNYHEGARAAGRAAGNSASLGRPLSGSAAALRIGRS